MAWTLWLNNEGKLVRVAIELVASFASGPNLL
jgi:hypothetical protein